MDYEKKYKEALERAKKLLDSYKLKAISVEEIEEIFPELQESEDERIINMISSFIRGSFEPSDEGKNAMLSWLEKQKKRESTLPGIGESELSPEEKMNHPLYLEGFDVGKRVGEVLKEQKPTEWSEEDDRTLTSALWHINNSMRNLPNNCIRDGMLGEKLTELCKRPQSHWKPSKEQMETLVEAITDEKLEDTASCDKKADILQSLYDDLEKLM